MAEPTNNDQQSGGAQEGGAQEGGAQESGAQESGAQESGAQEGGAQEGGASREQLSGAVPESPEEQRGAHAPPRPGPVSEDTTPQPPPNPNVPIQRSHELSAGDPTPEPSGQSGESSGSSSEDSGE